MYIITTALPYANGPLHCGHLLEAILADIKVRYLRAMDHEVLFLSGQDAHGVAITISATAAGETEENYIQKMHTMHAATYDLANIHFDIFTSTHTETNKLVTYFFYEKLSTEGTIIEASCTLPMDPQQNIFLADRFLKGTCPVCKVADQYGDHCEMCGATYTSSELIHPKSRLSDAPIVWQERSHKMIALEPLRDRLLEHLEKMDCLDAVKHKLKEWFAEPLRDWDITRDGPYFGFAIPERENQYFYVWLDAPCGYIAAMCDGLKIYDMEKIRSIWNDAHITHIIGKDITYFHGLFWPAMLHASGFKMTDAMVCHGFVTKNGEKMSKSKGTFIIASDLLQTVPSDALRYYFATKLSPGLQDIDISCNDFMDRIHADLIGKCINLGSRLSGFVIKHGEGMLAEPMDMPMLDGMRTLLQGIYDAYDAYDYVEVTKIIMHVCDKTNQWIDIHQPWKTAKTDPHAAWLSASNALQVYRWILIAIGPICPDLSVTGLEIFGHRDHRLGQLDVIQGILHPFVPLMQRFDRDILSAAFGEN